MRRQLSEVTMRFPGGRLRLVALTWALAWLGASTVPASAEPTQREIHDGIESAVMWAETMPDAFGGVWLSDGGAVFAFTHRATDAQVTEVLGLVEAGIPVTTVRVDWSEPELREVQHAIADAA